MASVEECVLLYLLHRRIQNVQRELRQTGQLWLFWDEVNPNRGALFSLVVIFCSAPPAETLRLNRYIDNGSMYLFNKSMSVLPKIIFLKNMFLCEKGRNIQYSLSLVNRLFWSLIYRRTYLTSAPHSSYYTKQIKYDPPLLLLWHFLL